MIKSGSFCGRGRVDDSGISGANLCSFPGRPSTELDDLARVTLLSNQAGGVMFWEALGQWRGGTCIGQNCGPQLPWFAGAPRPASPSCLPDVIVCASAGHPIWV